MSVQSSTELQERIDDYDDDHLAQCLGWLCLSSGGDADAHRERLAAFITGPTRRHRAGWLQLALDCTDEGGDDECDVDGVDLLFDLAERLDACGLLPSCLPSSIFKDLDRTLTAGRGLVAASMDYSLPDRFRWFTTADLDAFLGISHDDVSDLKAELATLKASQLDPAKLQASMRDTFALDVSENRFAVGSQSTVAIQRRTLAFHVNPEAFYLYQFRLHEEGRSRDLVPGSVDRDFLRKHLFDSQLTPEDIKKMERRSLVPESLWTQANARDVEDIAILGGDSSATFKQDESYRIQQQALLKKCQHIVHVIASSSRAHSELESVLFSAGPGHTLPAADAIRKGIAYNAANVYQDASGVDVVDIAGRDVLSRVEAQGLRAARSVLEESLFAASDSFHLFSGELSELERCRDELYVRARSGNDSFKIARPVTDPTRYTKDLSALAAMADKECIRQKNLLALKPRKQPFRDAKNQPPARGGKNGKNGDKNGRSRAQKQAQSQRDKKRAAARKASSQSAGPEPEYTPKPKTKKPFTKP